MVDGTAGFRAFLLSGVLISSLAPLTAAAGERLVMPYACRVYDGGVDLVPAEPRSYPIVGPRAQDTVTACAPYNASRCKTWRVFRFDIDCAGQRARWTDVVAAASRLNRGPASLRDGRLFVRMDPWWAPVREPSRLWPGDGPYSGLYTGRDGPYAGWGAGRYGRAPWVEMPEGFAPAAGIQARFEASDEGPAGSGAAPPPQGKGAVTARAGSGQVAPPVPKPAVKPSVAAAPQPAEKKPEVKTAAQTAPPQVSPQSEKSQAVPPAPASSGAEASGTSVTPKILNRTEPQSAQAPAGQLLPTTAIQPAGSQAAASPAPDAAQSPAATVAAATAPPSADGAKAVPVPVEVTGALPDRGHSRTALIAALIAAAATALVGTFYWLRHRERLPVGASRDFASVSLGGFGSKALVKVAEAPVPSTRSPAANGVAPPSRPDTGAAASHADGTAILAWANGSDWLPATRDEALQVVGAGPDASIDVLKKIVDGLRQSWHPDLAKSDDDRLVRENRMKQLNVAWEILSRGEPASRRPSAA